MYRTVISFLILVLLVGTFIALNPRANQETRDLWDEFRPTIAAWRDKFVEVIQAFLGVRAAEPAAPDPIQPDLYMEVIIT